MQKILVTCNNISAFPKKITIDRIVVMISEVTLIRIIY